MERVLSIDLMRGAALASMVLIHFLIYFGDSAAATTWPYFLFNHVLGDWGAACFLLLTGMSQTLSAGRRASDPRHDRRKALVRGAFLFLVGLLVLALAWGPSRIWEWDILTLMGAMTVVVFLCRTIPSWALLGVSLLVAVATPFLRRGIDYASVWGGPFVQVPVVSAWLPGLLLDPAAELNVIWTLPDVVRGFLFTGEFPLFPWALFPLVGVVVGRRILRGRIEDDLPLLAIIGGLLVCLGTGGAYASLFRPGSSIVRDLIAPLSIYPDSFTMIAVQLGLALLAFSGLYALLDARRTEPAADGLLVRLLARTSRFSLSFYFLHYLLIGWTIAIVHLATGRDTKYGLLGAVPSLVAGVAGVALLEGILVLWERREGRFSLEWCLASLTALLTGGPSADRTDSPKG